MDIEEVAAKTPEKILTRAVDPAVRLCAVPGPPAGLGARPRRRRRPSSRARFMSALYRAFLERTQPRRDQPAGGDQGRGVSRSTPRSTSTTTPCSATRTSRRCATSTRRTRSRSRPRSRASTTSSSTARSAAWSTAPAWPWPPWTSSSSRRQPANFLDVGRRTPTERLSHFLLELHERLHAVGRAENELRPPVLAGSYGRRARPERPSSQSHDAKAARRKIDRGKRTPRRISRSGVRCRHSLSISRKTLRRSRRRSLFLASMRRCRQHDCHRDRASNGTTRGNDQSGPVTESE